MTYPLLKLHLLRHGETDANRDGVLQGVADYKLNATGRVQIAALLDHIKLLPLKHIYASDLCRTRETAAILNASLNLPLSFSPLLRERDWGELTHCRVTEIDRTAFPPSVETMEQLELRATRFLNTCFELYAPQSVEKAQIIELLVVTHGLFARCLEAVSRGVRIQDTARMQNAELRTILLHAPLLSASIGESGVTAN